MTLEQAWRQVQGEAALIAEDIQRFAVSVLRGGRVVLALIEERAGLLSVERLVVKASPRSW